MSWKNALGERMGEDEEYQPLRADPPKLERYPRTSGYRNCAGCNTSFAPITSDANNRYKYCSPECES